MTDPGDDPPRDPTRDAEHAIEGVALGDVTGGDATVFAALAIAFAMFLRVALALLLAPARWLLDRWRKRSNDIADTQDGY